MQFIDKSMCSSLCPCDPTQKAKWEKALPADDAKKFERTWGASDATPFKTKGALVKLQFGKVTNGVQTEYKDFATCYTE